MGTQSQDPAGEPRQSALRWVRRNHVIRTGWFAYTFLTLGMHGWEGEPGAAFWIALVLSFLVYPHVLLLRASRAADPREAENLHLFVDAVLVGMWSAGLGFPTWIAYAGLSGVTLNAIIARGVPAAIVSTACFAAGGALCLAAFDLQYAPRTSVPVSTLCFIGSLGYALSVGLVVRRQWRRLKTARDELRTSEARYRLISENVGDLIAMIDHDGRWLYTSPSYERILRPEDLEYGADAFRRLHPDEADRTRVAVLGVAVTGKPREVTLRLMDRDGRTRQYSTRVLRLPSESPPQARLLLVSQDVTELRESEERLLLAGHALEGMTQAILITDAQGTVVSVNRAFCDITGYSRDDVLGRSEKAIRSGLQPAEFYDQAYATVHREGHWSGTAWSRRKNGAVYHEWRSLRALRDDEGRITHYMSVFHEAGGRLAAGAAG